MNIGDEVVFNNVMTIMYALRYARMMHDATYEDEDDRNNLIDCDMLFTYRVVSIADTASQLILPDSMKCPVFEWKEGDKSLFDEAMRFATEWENNAIECLGNEC